MFSWDEFAVALNKKTIKGAKVCTTRAADKELRSKRKALKNPNKGSGFQAKKSMAKLTITLAITPTGEILAAVYAVRENDFENKKGDPKSHPTHKAFVSSVSKEDYLEVDSLKRLCLV